MVFDWAKLAAMDWALAPVSMAVELETLQMSALRYFAGLRK
jgi:hypothetical protein